jgi:hypothetical protein
MPHHGILGPVPDIAGKVLTAILDESETHIQETGGRCPPPHVHLVAEDLNEPYLGYVICRRFYRGDDAAQAIADLGRLASALAATRLFVVWEERNLRAALGMPVPSEVSTLTVVDARADGHTVLSLPMAPAYQDSQLYVQWGKPQRFDNVPLPAPVHDLLHTWSQPPEDLTRTVQEMLDTGYRIMWRAPSGAEPAGSTPSSPDKADVGMDPTQFATTLLDPRYAPRAYSSDGELGDRSNSMWRGTPQALGILGLTKKAEVRIPDFVAAICGRHVRTGAAVMRSGSFNELVFAAPTSVSCVWSQLDAHRQVDIENTVLESAAVMLDHLVRHHPIIDGVRPAGSFVAALVLHAVGTLSAANGDIPPMLHVHCCLFGVLDDNEVLIQPHEGTLYDRDVVRVCDAVAERELANRLIQQGWPIRNTSDTGPASFEIDGIPQKVLDSDFWRNTGCAVVGDRPRA